ncbi:peptidoglycan-binding protein [Hoeflea sp.]|uniref:peptidoglycan-binding domain-containing protein n=1 Tax=Hoeflea sp. TaxID=1940281 RepID=UPI0019AD133A|nr:peptidoglycan-binding protein [Hoeflea sp.]MBC7281133.1 peptidoglycan-binding protein [Hoeflea sp.]
MSRQRAAPDLFEDETGSGHGVLGMLGHIVSAHPSLAGGSVAFSVIFGFIAANALWHQPGQHPAPILKTREIASPAMPVTQARPEAAIPLADGVPARTVTTYRIERNDETPTASIPVPNIAPVSAPVSAPAETAARPAADPVLSRIQTILSEQGLYSGAIDGLMGPKSAAAIRAWEKTNGYAETGAATPALLDIMAARPSVRSLINAPGKAAAQTAVNAPAPIPAPVKLEAQAPAPRAEPPVDLANLEDIPAPAPRPRPAPAVAADTRAGQPVTVPAADIPTGPSELVRRIQSGLSNIAYADITVDGVAGGETRAAISAFERHYRLPVTGEPNEIVLNKLIEIGAL